MLMKPSDKDIEMVLLSGNGKWKRILKEFLESNEPILEYFSDDPNKNLYTIRRSIEKVIRVSDYPVKIAMRHGRMFFIRKDI